MKINFRKAFYFAVGIFLTAPMVAHGYPCIMPSVPPGCTSGGTSGGGYAGGGGGGWNPGDYGSTGLPSASIGNIVENIAFWLLAIFGFVGVIGFVISGILYITAAGNEKQAEKAKEAMMMSIIGVVVGLVGLVVIQAVDSLLSASL